MMDSPSPESTNSAGDPLVAAKRVTKIESIRQRAGSFAADLPRVVGRHTTELSYEPATVRYCAEDRVEVSIRFSFRARPESLDPGLDEEESASYVEAPSVEVTAEYVAGYLLKPGDKVDDLDLQAFGDINGRLTLVPYWREFVQSSLARAELDQFTIPPYHPVKDLKRLRRRQESQSLPPDTPSTEQ